MSKEKKITDRQIDDIIEKQEKEPLTKEDEETLTDWVVQLVEEIQKKPSKDTIVYWLPVDGDN